MIPIRMGLLVFLTLSIAACGPQPLSLDDQAATNIASVNATQRAQTTQTAAIASSTPSPVGETPTRSPFADDIGWTCPADFSGQTLRVGNWSTYIDQQALPTFEAICGVTVEYIEYNDTDEVRGLLLDDANPLDVLVLSDADVALYAQEGLLMPLNREQLPNIGNLSADLTDRSFDPGNRYSIPYLWGTIGAGYNMITVNDRITSWRQVFENEALRVGWMSSPREILGIALVVLGFDPNTDDPDELAQARDYLIAHSDNAQLVDDDSGQTLLFSGDLDIVIEYSGDILQGIAECDCTTYAYVVPDEGTPFGLDNLALPINSRSSALAHAFLDFLMVPRIAAGIANTTAYASPNQVAINRGLIDAQMLDNPAVYPSEDARQNLFIINSTPELDALYGDIWRDIENALTD